MPFSEKLSFLFYLLQLAYDVSIIQKGLGSFVEPNRSSNSKVEVVEARTEVFDELLKASKARVTKLKDELGTLRTIIQELEARIRRMR